MATGERQIRRRKLRSNKPPLAHHLGYVLVFVGFDHHLAGPRGYAYEHRLVAERKLGRRLSSGEIVHHIDGRKRNNSPDNLEVFPSRWHHNAHHRKLNTARREPGQPNEQRPCACGCGQLIWRFNANFEEVRFVSGHNGKLNKKTRPPKDRQGAYLRARTHCPSGHEYSPDNTSIFLNARGQKHRRCLACHREREATRRAKRKEQAVV